MDRRIILSTEKLLHMLNEGGWFEYIKYGKHPSEQIFYLPIVEATLKEGGLFLRTKHGSISWGSSLWSEASKSIVLINPWTIEILLPTETILINLAIKEQQEIRVVDEYYQEAERHVVAKLTEAVVGKRLAGVSIVNDVDLQLEFDDGGQLSVQLAGGDIYEAWIYINGMSIDMPVRSTI